MRRTVWPLALAAALLAMLGVLATLQYRWLGDVSRAERERLRASLRARSNDFAADVDREISRIYAAFQIPVDVQDADVAGALSTAYARVAEGGARDLITAVYCAQGPGEKEGENAHELRQLDLTAGTLTDVSWPRALDALRSPSAIDAAFSSRPAEYFLTSAVDARIPALIVPSPVIHRVSPGTHVAVVLSPSIAVRRVIVTLNADALRDRLLSPLVAKHFGGAATSEFNVAVVTRDTPPQVVFASPSPAVVTRADADLVLGFFEVRIDEWRTAVTTAGPTPPLPSVSKGTPAPNEKQRFAIKVLRSVGFDAAGDDRVGAWQLLVRGKAGSLDALVARSRQRNLAVSLGVLALLAASVVFVIASAQRQRRLARQQMEFVAAVSHELRTPLAVIRSAGENLADGVVADGDQVRRYGSLIRSEGVRLSEMVERVLEFAGIDVATPRPRSAVDLGEIVREAADAVRMDASERHVSVEVDIADRLPRVTGDAQGLRSAIQNVIGNAVKYSPTGSTVSVRATIDSGTRQLCVDVADRGIGIDPRDLPHVFKPFYRGRDAMDAQISGTGIGLSVVRDVIDAHGGTVRVESWMGEGTTVRIVLPSAGPAPARAADAVRELPA